MASLIFKRKQGREYAYIVQSARVHGKPRVVKQIYLGPKDRFLRELQETYTRSQTPGPVAVRKLGSFAGISRNPTANRSRSSHRFAVELESIEEALVVYRNRTVDRVLSEMSSEQRTLAGSIGLLDLAKKMGTTVLKTQ